MAGLILAMKDQIQIQPMLRLNMQKSWEVEDKQLYSNTTNVKVKLFRVSNYNTIIIIQIQPMLRLNTPFA